MRKILISLLISTLVLPLNLTIPKAKAAISSDHPRIWLNAATLAELQSKVDSNHSTWTSLKSWADSNLGKTYTSEFYALNTGELINFAAVYQMTGDETYARAAIDKMLHMWDNPYISSSVSSLDDWVTGNSWYSARYLVPSSAVVFDWCYDAMTEDERTRFVNQLETWGDMILVSPQPSWAWHDSSNNFWYGYMWALTSAGYALHGHSDSSSAYLDYVRDTMVPEALAQVNNERLTWDISTGSYEYGRSGGGEWSEGNAYGLVNTDMFVPTLLAIMNAEGTNHFSQTSFFSDYILNIIYNNPPGDVAVVDVGDGYISGINSGKLKSPFIYSVVGAAKGDSNSSAARYGKYWLDENLTASSNAYKRYVDFIWYPVNQQSSNYKSYLGDSNFVDGMQIQTYRSDWTDSATWIYARFNMHYSDHTNDGPGHFSVWKNGWLIEDYAYPRYESPPPNDAVHNVVYFPGDGDATNGMLWDQPDILHRVNNVDYLYYAADSSDMYSGPEVRCDWRECNVSLNQRYFFHLKDEDYLMVYDRVRTDGASDEKYWQAYFPSTPQVSDNITSYSNGSAKVFVKTLLPTNANIDANSYYSGNRVQISYADTANYNNFLHAIEIRDGNPSTMNGASYLSSSDGSMVGALLNEASIVMFSEDGTAQDMVNYTVSASGTVEHYLTGLNPNTTYYLSGPGLSGQGTSDDGGVLDFTTSGAGAVSVSIQAILGDTGDPDPYCGDGTCNGDETCESCSSDCGSCVVEDPDDGGGTTPDPYCGDGTCNNGESCSTCDSDCGECTVEDPADDFGVDVLHPGSWCSVMYGLLQSDYLGDADGHEIINFNDDSTIDLSDLTYLGEYYDDADNDACYAQFQNYSCADYLNYDWCNGLRQGIEDSYGAKTGANNYYSYFDLNNDGEINLSDESLVAYWLSIGDTQSCYDEMSVELLSCSTSTVTEGVSDIGEITEEEAVAPTKDETIDRGLSDSLKGKILLQVEDNGEAWYVKPDNGKRIYMKDGAAAYKIMRYMSLGISNSDLAKIPVGFEDRFECLDSDGDGLCNKLEDGLGTDSYNTDSDGDGYDDGTEVRNNYNPLGTGPMSFSSSLQNRLRGIILLQVEAHGEAWYVKPDNGKRYYMPDGDSAYQIMRYLSLGITNSNLNKIDID